MELYEKRISGETIFSGRIVALRVDRVQLPNGREAAREVVSHPGGVAVVPYHQDGTVTVVRQFRYPFGRVITEVPAGKLERGEDHRLAGMRELEEETGLTAGSFTYLGALLLSPGFSDEVLHIYLARDLRQGPCHPDEDEFLELKRVPLGTLLEQVMRGELQDAKTVAALLKTQALLRAADESEGQHG